MAREVVRELLPYQAARIEAAALAEVFAEAWHERRTQPRGSPERALAERVVRDLVERLRRLPSVPVMKQIQ